MFAEMPQKAVPGQAQERLKDGGPGGSGHESDSETREIQFETKARRVDAGKLA